MIISLRSIISTIINKQRSRFFVCCALVSVQLNQTKQTQNSIFLLHNFGKDGNDDNNNNNDDDDDEYDEGIRGLYVPMNITACVSLTNMNVVYIINKYQQYFLFHSNHLPC